MPWDPFALQDISLELSDWLFLDHRARTRQHKVHFGHEQNRHSREHAEQNGSGSSDGNELVSKSFK